MSKHFKKAPSFLPCFKASKQTLSLVALSVAALFFSQASPAFANNFAIQAEQPESAARAAQAKQAESLAQTTQAVNAEQVEAAEQTQEQLTASYGDFEVTGEASTVSFADSVLTISGGEHTISMKEGVTSTAERIEVTGASTLTLSGVSIETASGPALKIADDATFDVNIVLPSGTENTLTTTQGECAALQKNKTAAQGAVGTLTISGAGVLAANGLKYGAGIGAGRGCGTSNITIKGGFIKATAQSAWQTSAIGAGWDAGAKYEGSNIHITGGVVDAFGGGGTSDPYTGVIGGSSYSSSGNVIDGNALVMASGIQLDSSEILTGFDPITGFVQGVVYTNASVEPGREQPWTSTIYGNATTITINPQATDTTSNTPVELPAGLTVPSGKTVTVGSDVTLTMASGKSITVEDGANLINASTTLAEDFPVTLNGTGTLSSEMNYYRKGTMVPYLANYQVYKTSAGVQVYADLPNPDTTNAFTNWYYLNDAGQKVAIQDGDSVLLNEHTFYEERDDVISTITVQPKGEGTIQPSATEAIEGATVTFTLSPKSGYKVEDGSVAVIAGATSVSVTDKGNLTYSFTMPASNVVISATFVADSPTPDITPASADASLLPVTGDMQHASISALLAAACTGMALLGMAGILKRRRD